MHVGTPIGQIAHLKDQIAADPRVDKVTYTSPAKALEIMKKQQPQIANIGLPTNPLPPTLTVYPKHGEETQAIAQALSPKPPGVDTVTYHRKTANQILRFARAIEITFVVAVVVLLLAEILMIGNTIRLSIFARRREIEVMKLVGATNWFIRGPFMLEGLLCGLTGSALAVILLLLGKTLALPSILPHIGGGTGSDVHALSFTLNALALLVAGLLLGALGSGLTLRRFLQV